MNASKQNSVNEEKITQVNELIEAWKGQFDEPPASVDLHFSADEKGDLYINDVKLCPLVELDIGSLTVDVEQLRFDTESGEIYLINIAYLYDETVLLDSVFRMTAIYQYGQ